MKKIAALFLLFIFLFNTIGFYFVFKALQYQAKAEIYHEIKAGFFVHDLEKLIINKKDLAEIRWLKKGKEMLYNNQLYDVVKSMETSSEIIYYCINDSKEKSILKGLNEHINIHVVSNKSTTDDSSKKIIDTVVKIYYSNAFSFYFVHTLSDVHFFAPTFNYISASIETNSPPPEFI